MSSFFLKYKVPICGAIIGGLIAILFFTIGFIKTIVFIVFVCAGAYSASALQNSAVIQQLLQKINRRN